MTPRRFWKILPLLFALACATPSVFRMGLSADALYSDTCLKPVGTAAQGSVWLEIEDFAEKGSGSFPALLKVEEGGPLRLEIIDLLGSPIARLTSSGNGIQAEFLRKEDERYRSLLSGISQNLPEGIIRRVLLGGVPCFAKGIAVKKDLIREPPELNVRLAKNSAESIRYGYRLWDGAPWVERVDWAAQGRIFSFSFDQPSDRAAEKGIARVWTLELSGKWKLRVRWRDRKVVFSS